jgi:hypothetical protein
MMAWLGPPTAKAAHRSVLATLHVASAEKLMADYTRCVEAYRDLQPIHPSDETRSRTAMLIVDTQKRVAEELQRRGIETDMSRAMTGAQPTGPAEPPAGEGT